MPCLPFNIIKRRFFDVFKLLVCKTTMTQIIQKINRCDVIPRDKLRRAWLKRKMRVQLIYMINTQNMYINHDFTTLIPKECNHARLSDYTSIVLLTIYSSISDII